MDTSSSVDEDITAARLCERCQVLVFNDEAVGVERTTKAKESYLEVLDKNEEDDEADEDDKITRTKGIRSTKSMEAYIWLLVISWKILFRILRTSALLPMQGVNFAAFSDKPYSLRKRK
jgi:hypothetical protein